MPTQDASPNLFRQALSSNRSLIGIWSMLNSTTAVEGLAYSGFDWILIDGEHSPVSLQDAMSHLRVLAGLPVVPIVRLPWNDHVLLKQYLDAGATTIMLPYIQGPEDAAAAVSAIHYPPRGVRGVAAMHRASRYGRVKDYFSKAGEEVFLIVQAETPTALANLEAIAATDGIDAVFFGPGDLAAGMGLIGQPAHPDVTSAIEDGIRSIQRVGKVAGVLAPNPDLAERHILAGAQFVSVANDCAILFQGADALASRFLKLADTVRTSVMVEA